MRISSIINDVCKELNINYQSKHLGENLKQEDIATLIKDYFQLKQIEGDLIEIEGRCNVINGVRKDMLNAIKKLDSIAHLLFSDAYKIKNRRSV